MLVLGREAAASVPVKRDAWFNSSQVMNQTSDSKNKLPRLAYTVEEVAEMLTVAPKTIRRRIDAGVLKTLPGIRHKRITASSLEQVMALAV